jgi:hypothetical protein
MLIRAILLIAALLLACSQSSVQQSELPLQDVPIPEGMTYEGGHGKRTTPGGLRVYTLAFTGKRRRDELAQWYRETLPAHGWTLKPEKDGWLVFEKKDERCSIAISETTDGARVKLALRPKAAARVDEQP